MGTATASSRGGSTPSDRALATEFRVNSYTVGNQRLSVIASDGDGDFVMVWEGPGGSDPDGVFGRRFNSSGNPLATEFRANNATAGNQKRPSIDMDSDGDFVVTWMSPDGSMYGIFAQRFTSAGAPTGPEFQVNTYETGNQWYPSVGLDADGDFVVAWEDYTQDGDRVRHFRPALRLRRHASGRRVPGQQPRSRAIRPAPSLVATDQRRRLRRSHGLPRRSRTMSSCAGSRPRAYPPATQSRPTPTPKEHSIVRRLLEADSDGDFVVSWASGDEAVIDVFAQRFDAPLTIDVDGDGQYLPLTDGLLMLRFGFGFSGAHAHHRRGRPGCTRCDAPSITTYLQSLV